MVAISGVGIFLLLSLPMPWMLGSLFGVLAAQFLLKIPMRWPVSIRNAGLLIVGTAIGQYFTLEVLIAMKQNLLFMFLFNVILSLLCLLLAYAVHKVAGLSIPTAITASIPGGLSQLVVFAEEQKNMDVAVVTFFHVIRVICVVGLIPIIVSLTGELPKQTAQVEGGFFRNMALILVGWMCIPIGKRCRLPVPYFLTPVILGLLVSFTEIEPMLMNANLLHIAQLAIGAYIGLLLKPKDLRLPKMVIASGIFSALLLLFLTFIVAEGMVVFFKMDFATSYLSTAPGGMDQMGLIAAALQADATQVTVFQLFRMLFIYIVILPVLKWRYSEV
ncbi:MAG: AbrB family transcriptional regulator [Lysinibacillus sp.]